MKIKDIPKENRPRERLKEKGIDVLTDAEVLAIILQKGTRSDNVIDISNKLIATYGLEKLSTLSITELTTIKGIGEAKGMQILCAFELSKRVKTFEGTKIGCAKDVFDKYHKQLKDLKQEHQCVNNS